MVIVPGALLWVREALVRGLDASEPLGGAFDIVRVLVRMLLEGDFSEPGRGQVCQLSLGSHAMRGRLRDGHATREFRTVDEAGATLTPF